MNETASRIMREYVNYQRFTQPLAVDGTFIVDGESDPPPEMEQLYTSVLLQSGIAPETWSYALLIRVAEAMERIGNQSYNVEEVLDYARWIKAAREQALRS